MNVLFAGGGTLGPVTPLLAVVQAWKAQESGVSFFWAGTPHGPEREVVEKAGIPFFQIIVARLPRYLSLEWVKLPFVFLRALRQSWCLISKVKPDVIGAAGGYTSVPIVFVGWMRGIPSWIHQMDGEPLLSNRLLAPFATRITVTWPDMVYAFPAFKTVVLGNPVRADILEGSLEKAKEIFSLDLSLPTVLILGGGSGSRWINQTIAGVVPWILERANVIHQVGKGKIVEGVKVMGERYHTVELLTDALPHAFAVADVVICRAGMGTLTELVALQKPTILIPLPDSPQEANAKKAKEAGGAIVIDQKMDGGPEIKQVLGRLLNNRDERQVLGESLGKLFQTKVIEPIVDMLRKMGEG
ncbi:TPA: hypothetical protein DEP34_00795 [Candidatus Uhrbacteria bacterium]|uniref:UDP-N-acetylglucosamine--N-acetylmuramyl-(pentapeptide) pyrophosphoryl-undecaprenol N-acetylglucosamine transferase n=2 Tax=Candidatus Uhriibacteriota TaxID=1752732 RepID=A0A0G1Q9V2_9BACT|nr:MAG: UDP-diphospho-muramoylpentapeptide beta-N- acetylglucosaminyltransferase [Candidatus Uhrbacteria bacterium GW2011_GWF2_46_218]KKU41836.1 MAG: UDP-diphospho-muramoylpentapeptide beta-N- acetylglucosaminyltransferase [Candidatus Uhrbacteria bacterium GW2011_GWE2_46_68]HBK34114.1 hypothetical protein [Candidatus Uhrbacteria bacterium]HCB18909.1 hypothetical protein [Candidatus Uhrbacteria bacterium]